MRYLVTHIIQNYRKTTQVRNRSSLRIKYLSK